MLRKSCVAIAAFACSFNVAAGDTRNVAISGALSPIDSDGQFATFDLPILTRAGTTAFIANLVGSASTQGVYGEGQDILDPYGPSNVLLYPILRQGMPSGDGDYDTFSNLVGGGYSENVGQVAFNVSFTGSSSTAGTYFLARNNETLASSVVRNGDSLFYGDLYEVLGVGAPVISVPNIAYTNGTSYFTGDISNLNFPGPDQAAIIGQSRWDTWVQETGTFYLWSMAGIQGDFASIADLSVSYNEWWQTDIRAFRAEVTNAFDESFNPEPDYSGVFVSDPDYGSVVRVDHNGGNGDISFGAPVVNAHSADELRTDVAYRRFDAAAGSQEIRKWNRGGSVSATVAGTGDASPDGNGEFVDFSDPDLSGNGHIAFHANLTNTVGGATDEQGLFRELNGPIDTIVRTGDSFGGLTFTDLSTPVVNTPGVLLFKADVSDGLATTSGLFLGNVGEYLTVVRQGDALDGSFVVSADTILDPNRGGNSAFNDFGQVAYRANLLDGRQGVYVFTPDLEYRGGVSGSFDDASDWTVGLLPGAPHSIVIAPTAGDVVVAGPASDPNTFEDKHIRNLSITPGAGATAEVVHSRGRFIVDDTLLIGEGGTFRLAGTPGSGCCAELQGGQIELQGGNIVADPGAGSMWFESLSGFGLLSGWVQAGNIIVDGGLLKWNTESDGLYAANLLIKAGAELQVISSSPYGSTFYLGGTTTLEGGTLSTPGGIAGGHFVGHGTIIGAYLGDDEDNDLVEASGGLLTIGDPNSFFGFSTASDIIVRDGAALHLRSKTKSATLGRSTVLEGGTLSADAGVFLPGNGTIAGRGAVATRVAAQVGSAIVAEGDLELGDAGAFDGYFSDGLLVTGTNAVTLHDRDRAVLGSLTLLGEPGSGAGTLIADNGLLVEFGKTIEGWGEVYGDVLNNGRVHGEGPGLFDGLIFHGLVHGVGTYSGGTTFAGGFSPGLSPTIARIEEGNTSSTFYTEMEIGGLIPGSSGHDQIIVTGNGVNTGFIQLGGTLDIKLINGWLPSLGDAYVLILAEEIMFANPGNALGFDVINFPALTQGLQFVLDYLFDPNGTDSLTLRVTSAVPVPPALWVFLGPAVGLLLRRRGRRA